MNNESNLFSNYAKVTLHNKQYILMELGYVKV